MRYIFPLIFILFSCITINKTVVQENETNIEITEKLNSSVYKIYVERIVDNEIKGSRGTGFLVKNNLIITCYHVIKNHYTITVGNTKERSYATVVYSNKELDVTLLKTDKYMTGDILMLEKTAIQGEKVLSFGYGINLPSVKSGVVSNIDSDNIIIDINIKTGDSGSPVVNMSGNVICVIKSYYGYETELSILVPYGLAGCVPVDKFYSEINSYLK